jgi:hypothetical protein
MQQRYSGSFDYVAFRYRGGNFAQDDNMFLWEAAKGGNQSEF